jgi:hypothetical protein
MKVIAKIDSNRVLCEVSRDELAHLNGFRSTYDTDCNIELLMKVDSVCDLKRMVTTSQYVRSMRSDTLKKTKEKLEEAIQNVDAAMEVVGSLELFNILKEDKQIGDS